MSNHRTYLSPLLALALLSAAQGAGATVIADTVLSFSGGVGFGVIDYSEGAYTGAVGNGVYDPLAVTSLDGAALALGGTHKEPGQIVMSFSGGSVVDGDGADIRVYDSINAPEGLFAEASLDGLTFFPLGLDNGLSSPFCSMRSPCAAEFDLGRSELEAASIFRFSVAGRIVLNYPQGFDLDAVEALSFVPAALDSGARALPIPEPAAVVLFGLGLLGARSRRPGARGLWQAPRWPGSLLNRALRS